MLLVYARSSSVEAAILRAHKDGTKFRVIVVDSRPKLEGKKLLEKLSSAGVSCTYILINALSYVMKEVSKVTHRPAVLSLIPHPPLSARFSCLPSCRRCLRGRKSVEDFGLKLRISG